jgi:hypothetical protein
MVKSSEYGHGRDRAGERDSVTLGGNRSPLPDPLVRPSRVEVAQCVFSEDVPEILLGLSSDRITM